MDQEDSEKIPTAIAVNNKHFLDYLTAIFALIAALAACYAAYVALDNEQKQVRAYVFLKDIRLDYLENGFFDVIPEWENSGASQTVSMKARLNFYFSQGEIPDGFNFGDLSQANAVPIVLGPKAVTSVTFAPLEKNCLSQFNRRDGISKFYIWGWAKYRDTLTKDEHTTRFCWDIHKAIFSEDKKTVRLAHSLCPSGNCSENDCNVPKPAIYQLPIFSCKPESQKRNTKSR